MVEQGNGSLPGWGWSGSSRFVASQQLNQGCRHLFGPAPGPLGLERMPVAVPDGQPFLQLPGQFQGSLRPGRSKIFS